MTRMGINFAYAKQFLPDLRLKFRQPFIRLTMRHSSALVYENAGFMGLINSI